MSKHTPGPWHLTRTGDGKRFLVGDGLVEGPGGYEIAEVYADDCPYELAAANARLIAAAPELLAAVCAFVAWLNAEDGKPDFAGLTRDMHPEGERIWQEWFDRNARLCKMAQELGNAILKKLETGNG